MAITIHPVNSEALVTRWGDKGLRGESWQALSLVAFVSPDNWGDTWY
jgi:hypothetical protein